MSSFALLATHIAVYSAFPVLFVLLGRAYRLIAFYVYIAITLLVGGYIGALYTIDLAGDVLVPAGAIFYVAVIFTSLVLVIVERDANVVRDIIKIALGVSVFKIITYALTAYTIGEPPVRDRLDAPADVLDMSLRMTVAGGLLIVVELVLLVLVYEALNRRLRSPALLSVSYILIFVAVLCLDGLLFPLVALTPTSDLGGAISDDLGAKVVLAAGFSVPYLIFMIGFRGVLAAYRQSSLSLHELVHGPSVDLVHEVERQRLALRAGAEQYRQLVESTGDVVIGSTFDGTITSWNHAAERLYGHGRDRAVGASMELITPDDRLDELSQILRTVSRGTLITELETAQKRVDDTIVEVSLTVSPVVDHRGRIVGLSYLGRDVGERQRMERTLQYQATHDALTGLPNRVYLEDRIAELARGTRSGPRSIAVLFLDIDQFKIVNDAAGHHIGDSLLIEAAARLRSVLQIDDIVARFGGDEFVVMCRDEDESSARRIAQDLLDALAQPFEIGGHRFFVTASVGIAVATSSEATELVRRSDTAMYAAKASGGGVNCRVFDESMDDRAHWRLALANDLGDAIEHDRLDLHYQPVVDLSTGAVSSVEALTRWHHETWGNVEPEQFISVAEDTGMITSLDTWVLRRACRDGARLLESGALPVGGHVAVNLSVHDIADPDICQVVSEAISDAGSPLKAHHLMIEITETVLMSDVENAAVRMRELHDLGVQIAIDDFGTGYSSLAYLRPFPTRRLKIDQTFVSGIADNQSDLAIVRSVVQLAHALEMETVAEGVEDARQLELLIEMNCDAAQGFLWSPALAMDGYVELIGEAGRLAHRPRT